MTTAPTGVKPFYEIVDGELIIHLHEAQEKVLASNARFILALGSIIFIKINLLWIT